MDVRFDVRGSFPERNRENLTHSWHRTPFGAALVVWDEDGGVRLLSFAMEDSLQERQKALDLARARLGGVCSCAQADPAHADGRMAALWAALFGGADMTQQRPPPHARAVGTEFQIAVWRGVLAHVPLGQTCSYAELGVMLGKPRSARAIGGALSVNPLALIVPCHRVLSAHGGISGGGYAWGMGRKKAILAFESRISEDLKAASAQK